MKKYIFTILLLSLVFSISNTAEARTIKVKSYYKPSTGKYVNSHYKTSPNRTRLDNFSTKGSYNPFTGKKGSVKPFKY